MTPPTAEELAILSGVLAAGVFVEAVAGFGGTILALALGVQWFSIEALLAWFLPLNLALSTTLAVRGRAAIDRPLLGRRILPVMGLGLVGGTALAWVIVADRAKLVFAGVVVVVAVAELALTLRRTSAAAATGAPTLPAPPAPWVERGLLVGAGLAHGLFATGGPLAVAVIGRLAPDKATMRATLAVLWLSLNVLVLARLTVRGDLTASTLVGSAALAPALLVGLTAGEWVHRRASEAAFRRAVAALLLLCAALVLMSAW